MRTLNQTWEALDNGGTTQTFPVIPASQLASHADIMAHMQACRPRPAHAADNDLGRIFVVDTYPDLATFALLMLEQGGYQARAFESQTTAWHAFAFANPKPDVLITDEGKGGLNGLELIRLCKQINPKLKTLLITAKRRAELARGDRALVDDVLPTAYCGPLLVTQVTKLMQTARSDWWNLWGVLGRLSPRPQKASI